MIIKFNMTPTEARRLANVCFHIAEECGDGPDGESCFDKVWWMSLGHHVRDEMRKEISEEFIIGLKDEN